jgi:hypothetical protein
MYVSIKRAAEILDMKISNVYSLLNKGLLTPYKPFGGKVFIKEAEIYEKIEAGRQVTREEMGRVVALDQLDKKLKQIRNSQKDPPKRHIRKRPA